MTPNCVSTLEQAQGASRPSSMDAGAMLKLQKELLAGCLSLSFMHAHGAGGAPRQAQVLSAGRGTGMEDRNGQEYIPVHSCRQEGKKIAGGRNAPAILPNQKMYTWACRGAPPAPWARLRDSSAHNTSPCMPSETHVKGDVAETETRRGLEKSLIQLKESYAEQERLRAKESEQQVDVKMILCSMASANTLDLDRHEHKLNVSYRNRT